MTACQLWRAASGVDLAGTYTIRIAVSRMWNRTAVFVRKRQKEVNKDRTSADTPSTITNTTGASVLRMVIFLSRVHSPS